MNLQANFMTASPDLIAKLPDRIHSPSRRGEHLDKERCPQIMFFQSS